MEIEPHKLSLNSLYIHKKTVIKHIAQCNAGEKNCDSFIKQKKNTYTSHSRDRTKNEKNKYKKRKNNYKSRRAKFESQLNELNAQITSNERKESSYYNVTIESEGAYDSVRLIYGYLPKSSTLLNKCIPTSILQIIYVYYISNCDDYEEQWYLLETRDGIEVFNGAKHYMDENKIEIIQEANINHVIDKDRITLCSSKIFYEATTATQFMPAILYVGKTIKANIKFKIIKGQILDMDKLRKSLNKNNQTSQQII